MSVDRADLMIALGLLSLAVANIEGGTWFTGRKDDTEEMMEWRKLAAELLKRGDDEPV